MPALRYNAPLASKPKKKTERTNPLCSCYVDYRLIGKSGIDRVLKVIESPSLLRSERVVVTCHISKLILLVLDHGVPLLSHCIRVSCRVVLTKCVLECLIEGRTYVETDVLKHLNVTLYAGTYNVVLKLVVIVLVKDMGGMSRLIVEVCGALCELLSGVRDRTDSTDVVPRENPRD